MLQTPERPVRQRGRKMCDKCVELDEKIRHYERIRSAIIDRQAIDGIRQLIEQIKARKSAFHPDAP
jgi:N-methylhydantoinase A/oxoprolinase/acetone carboxylase beta subunit